MTGGRFDDKVRRWGCRRTTGNIPKIDEWGRVKKGYAGPIAKVRKKVFDNNRRKREGGEK